MGRGQVVRQRFLVPKIVGSIPTAPAKMDIVGTRDHVSAARLIEI
jgi:hypothetical protein